MATKPPAAPPAGRRQPARQARNAPRKNLASKAPERNGSLDGQPSHQPPKKFYPALTAFTDAIDALPAEVIRHFTLLREVDAKACGPDANLRRLVDAAERLPAPAEPFAYDSAVEMLKALEDLRRKRDDATATATLIDLERREAQEAALPGGQTILGQPETRRARCAQIRAQIAELIHSQEEKIHVITAAVDALQKHIARVEHAFAYVEIEIPEIYRLGNKEHWAYKDPVRKGTAAAQARQHERERREQEERYHAAVQREPESNARGESRREAALAKKAAAQAAAHHDDEGEGLSQKKSQKVRKDQQETLTSTKRLAEQTGASGGGPTQAGPSQPKRRKVTKEDKGKEVVRITGSPRPATPVLPKKSKANATNNNTARGGKRNPPTPSAAHSPVIASSPLHPTFSSSLAPLSLAGSSRRDPTPTREGPRTGTSTSKKKDKPDKAEAAAEDGPAVLAKLPDAPPVQDNVDTMDTDMPMNGPRLPPPETEKESDEHPDAKAALEKVKESPREKEHVPTPKTHHEKEKKKPERPSPVPSSPSGSAAVHPDKEKKPEKRKRAATVGHDKDIDIPLPPPQLVGLGLTIPTSTPKDEKDQERPRPTPINTATAKSSRAASADTHTPTSSKTAKRKSRGGGKNQYTVRRKQEEDADDEGDGEGEERYCYCNQFSFGSMVACDNEDCAREWFHWSCVGLKENPLGNWYCNECKEIMANRGRRVGSSRA